MHQKTLLALSSIALALAPFQICAQERQPNNIQKQPQQTNHIQPETNQPEQSANDLAALIPQQDLDAMQKAYDEGAYSRAIALAQEALKKAPNAHKLYALIGNAYLLNGAPNDAIAYIQKAQQLGAPLAASTGALCLAYSSVDAKSLPPNAAIDTCIDAANQNPDNDAIQFRAANHLTNANRFDEATTFYRRALERDPENISYLTALTSNLANTGDYEQAYRLTDKAALTTHAKMPILYHNASIYAYHAKLYDEATAWCNRARDAFGNDDAYDITQAYVEYARGNFDDSLRLIQIPNRLDIFRDNRANLILAKNLFTAGKLQALPIFMRLKNSTVAQGDPQFRPMFALAFVSNLLLDEATRYCTNMRTAKNPDIQLMGNLIQSIIPLYSGLKLTRHITPTQQNWSDLKNADRQHATEYFKLATTIAGSPQKLHAFIDSLPALGYPKSFIDAFKLVESNVNPTP